MDKKNFKLFLTMFLFFFLPTYFTGVFAEEIVLKVLAINPSKDKEQVVPMKTYLPSETKPENVINRDELKIGFDTDRSLFYVEKEVKLKPGESHTMQVRIEDVWVIPEDEIHVLQERADQAIEILTDTYSYDVAKILYDNIIQSIKIVEGHIETAAEQLPQERIANYRLDIKLLEQAKKDAATLDAMSKDPSRSRKISGSKKDDKAQGLGTLAFSWKLIMGVIGFLALLSFGSFIIWQGQLKGLTKIKEVDTSTRVSFANPRNLKDFLNAEEKGTENKKLEAMYKDAQEMSKTDELTKLNNRRQFFEILKTNITVAEATKQPFYLVLFDIDLFKQINDRYGHLFGDQVITSVAQAAKQSIRTKDHIGRYGGDEFIVIFNETGSEDILKSVQRMSDAIRALKLSANSTPVSVKVSFGVARFEPGTGMTDKVLIDKADQELLEVKRTERGQIGIAGL